MLGQLHNLGDGENILGNYDGQLSNSDEKIRLRDAYGNIADEVHYYESGRWPKYADGYGSSLELIDPRQDNNNSQAWAPSDETGKSAWTFFTYTEAGSYMVTCIAEDANGDLAEDSVAITVTANTGSTPEVMASAAPMTGVVPLLVDFTGSATGGDGTLTYDWDFGDGTTEVGSDPIFEYWHAVPSGQFGDGLDSDQVREAMNLFQSDEIMRPYPETAMRFLVDGSLRLGEVEQARAWVDRWKQLASRSAAVLERDRYVAFLLDE